MNIMLIAYEHFITFFKSVPKLRFLLIFQARKKWPHAMQRLIKYLRKKIEVSKYHPHFI